MEPKDEEIIDSPNDKGEETPETPADTPEKDEQYTDREKQLFARAKKAEAELKELRGEGREPKNNRSTDFGYDVKAYLKASGIQANEFDFVKAELKASGLSDVDALLENDYFKAKLEKHREITRTQEAAPSGKRSGGAATDSVDYWLAKPFEEVPLDKRRDVLNARIAREGGKSQFYNTKG